MVQPEMHPWREEEEPCREEEEIRTGSRKRGRWDDADVDAGDDADDDADADAEEEGGRARDRKTKNQAADVMVLTGVTMQGISVAVRVFGWSIPIYIMPCSELASHPSGISRLMEWLQVVLGPCTLEVQHRMLAYGFCPDPTNPAQRRLAPIICARFESQKTLKWSCHRLNKILSREMNVDTLASSMNSSSSRYILENNHYFLRNFKGVECGGSFASIEEGDRLRPEFKFLDEREIPPASWVVVSRAKWEASSEPFSFRMLNADVHNPKFVYALDTLNQTPQLKALLEAGIHHLPQSSPPDTNSVPPTLLAYCDIESRSHDRKEFPDPTKPDAPCYMFGVSFVWAFEYPHIGIGNGTGSGSGGLCEGGEAGEGNDHEESARRQALEDRRIRLSKRSERLDRYVRYRELVEDILCGPLETMNSDDESDGEERAVSRAVAEASKTIKKKRQLAEDLSKAIPWGELGLSGESSCRSHPPPPIPSPTLPLKDRPFLRVLLVLGTCDPIPDAMVVCFQSEKRLLEAIKILLFGLMDVDGIRGYNWLGFDTRYIVARAVLHNITQTALRWSHIPSRPPNYDKTEYALNLQRGTFRLIRLHQTNTVDMMIYMRQQLDLSSYKLEAIAQNFGIDGKHPVTPDDIYLAFEGTDAERARVGAYCLRDCDVLVDIARACQFEITLLQFSRIMLTPSELMWTSGQQIRVIHQLIWQAHRNGFVVDGLFRDRAAEDTALRQLESGKNFSGGFVMKPVVGHHRTPTATCDFKSLYPSIMISHKLCFSTALLPPYDSDSWIRRIEAAGLEVVRVHTESGTFAFVQHATNLIPDMEWKLWVSRQMIKKDMKKAAGDPLMYAVLDAKQLAVKVSMNSTFGATGAEFALLGMKRIAAAITHIGRTTVQRSRDYADSLRGCHIPEISPGIRVLQDSARLQTVYGDTDSIMVNLPDALTPEFVQWVRESGHLFGEGEAAADAHSFHKACLLRACRHAGDFLTEELNKTFRKPMEIEFEEVASEAIFLKPKMYTKNVIEDVSDDVIRRVALGQRVGKLKVSGIAAKRRDRSALTKKVQKGVAMSIVHLGNEARALMLVRRWITRLALYEIEIDDFLITTELKNPKERVGFAVQPWVAVAWAMEKKMRGSEPVRGERVPWLIVRKADPTRTVPPESKRAYTSDFIVPTSLDHYTVGQLLESLHNFSSHIDPAEQQVYFGERNLLACSEHVSLASIGISFGHRLTLCGKAGPASKTAISFRLRAEDGHSTDEEEEEDHEDEEQELREAGGGLREAGGGLREAGGGLREAGGGLREAGGPPPASSPTTSRVPSALAMMMFNARDMTIAERRNLGKKRVESDSLSPFARHPQEIESIKEVDVNVYMKHISQALGILLKDTRPDLWREIQSTLSKSRPLIDIAQGKPRQGSLKGFFRAAK